MILLKDGQQIGETIDQKQLTQIVDAIAELDNLIIKITKKGLNWNEYLKFRQEGKMPIFRVVDQNQVRYIFSDKEWKEFKAELVERKKQMQQENGELPVDGLTEEVLPEYKELWELPRINILADKLEKKGLHLHHYGTTHVKPVYRLKDEKNDVHDLASTNQLIEKIRELGRRGATIQRYKGLGEMNPEQLWKTTMDPERRKMLQVKLEDAIETDRIFTVLMGDKVEARRAFIQTHSLDVTNLDI